MDYLQSSISGKGQAGMNTKQSQSCGAYSKMPPPPPRYSARYMISLSKEELINTFEFEFEPVITSEIHPSRSIGVKIKSFCSSGRGSTNNNTCTRNNVQVGDVLYRLDGLLVKTEFFDHIMNLLSLPTKDSPSSHNVHNNKKATVSLTFERQSLASIQTSSSNKQISTKDEYCTMKENVENSNFKTRSSNQFSYVRHVSFDNKETSKFINDDHGLRSAPSQVSISSSAFSSHDDSSKGEEEQVLHSIFSPTVTNNADARDGLGTLLFSDQHNHSTISAGKNNLSFSVFSNDGFASGNDCSNSKISKTPQKSNSISPSSSSSCTFHDMTNDNNIMVSNVCSSSKSRLLHSSEKDHRIHNTAVVNLNASTSRSSRKSIKRNDVDEDSPIISAQDNTNDHKALKIQKFETGTALTRKINGKFFSPELCYSSASSVDETGDNLLSPLGVNIVIDSKNDNFQVNDSQDYVVPEKKLTAPIFRIHDDKVHKSNDNGDACYDNANMQDLNTSQRSLRLQRATKLSSNSSISTYTFQDENKENIYFQTPYRESNISYGSDSVGMSCSVSSVYHSPLCDGSNSNTTISYGNKSKRANQLDTSTRSWHNIPVKKLTCDFVNQCEDESELVKISNALSLTNPSKYPSLLRMTNKRLESIRKQKLQGINLDQNANNQWNNDTSAHYTNYDTSDNLNDCNQHDNNFVDGMEKKIDSALSEHAHIANGLEQILKDKDKMYSLLSSEVKDLKIKLEDSSKEMLKQQSIHFQKITDLETIKDNLENEILILDDMVVSSSAQARKVTNEMNLKTKEIEKLQEILRLKEAERIQDIEESERIKIKLNQRIEDLSEKLELQVKETYEARRTAEKELRKEFEAKSREQKSRISHLTRKLAETHIHLDSVQKKNENLSINVKSLEEQLCKSQKLDDVMKQVEQAQMATILITRALEESENELKLSKEINELSEQRINELKSENRKLESEKKTLSEKISQLTDELQKSRLTINKLTREIETKPDARKVVKKIIESKVSKPKINIYENGMRNNDDKISHRSVTRIQTPGNYKTLDQAIACSKNAEARRVTPPAIKSHKCDTNTKANFNDISSTCNKENMNSNENVKNFSKRVATVRALGGRAALQEKINKSRFVTLKNNNEKLNTRVPSSARIPLKRHDLNQQTSNISHSIHRQGCGKENLRQ